MITKYLRDASVGLTARSRPSMHQLALQDGRVVPSQVYGLSATLASIFRQV